jgi:hypothetical protein
MRESFTLYERLLTISLSISLTLSISLSLYLPLSPIPSLADTFQQHKQGRMPQPCAHHSMREPSEDFAILALQPEEVWMIETQRQTETDCNETRNNKNNL